MFRVLLIQSRICYLTALIVFIYAVWNLYTAFRFSEQVSVEKGLVFSLLALGVFLVGLGVSRIIESQEDIDEEDMVDTLVDF